MALPTLARKGLTDVKYQSVGGEPRAAPFLNATG